MQIRSLRWLAACTALQLSSATVEASPATVEAQEAFVGEIRAYDCPGSQVQAEYRPLTGFRLSGLPGVVTALHGVANCKRIVSRADWGRLELSHIDLKHDLALLQKVKGSFNGDGLEVGKPSPSAAVVATGHPYGIMKSLSVSGRLREAAIVPLKGLLPPGPGAGILFSRESPSIGINVLSVEAHLVPGLSGAPLLRADNQKLIGVVNGGIADGTTEITWAVPISDAEWMPIEKATAQLLKLQDSDGLLFSMDPIMEPSQTVRCFDENFIPLRDLWIDDVARASDDPMTLQALVQIYGLNGLPIGFSLYRGATSAMSLVVPHGWTLASRGDACVASNVAQHQELLFELLPVPQRGDVAALNETVVKHEHRRFCDRGFFVSREESNVTGRAVPQKGLITQRRSYYRQDLRCGPAGLATNAITDGTWQRLPPPQLLETRPNRLIQCVAEFNLRCPPPYQFYPTIWQSMQVPLESRLVEAWGFSIYVAHGDRVLAATTVVEDPELFARWDKCLTTLWEGPVCNRALVEQRTRGEAIIAATASSLRGR